MDRVHSSPSLKQNNPGMSELELKYRRQFVASFEPSDRFLEWQHSQLAGAGLHIYAHPDLEMTIVSNPGEGTSLILLGYAIDPKYPERNNRDIVNALLEDGGDSIDALAVAICSLAGRFVIIVAFPRGFMFFTTCVAFGPCFMPRKLEKPILHHSHYYFQSFFPCGRPRTIVSSTSPRIREKKAIIDYPVASVCMKIRTN